MLVPYYQVDAFTDRVFGGNPAAVCPLERWLPAATMQAIAAESNLADTAFFVKKEEEYELRWFTPTVEVDLCGHATLASAYVILHHIEPGRDRVSFRTINAGTLVVSRQGERLAMDLPARVPIPVTTPVNLVAALGKQPKALLGSRDYLAVYDNADEVAALDPDMAAVAKLDRWGMIVTAPGKNGVDFVSRFFAPANGIPEDPVTGSAHCTLVPYWAARLGKTQLEARQISRRGGALSGTLDGDRVIIVGRAVLYLEGRIAV